MLNPGKKPGPRVSGRAAMSGMGGGGGLSPEAVGAMIRTPLTAAERAQEQRYQQITRSLRSYAQRQAPARQDGPIAYHAQARARAELKYQAIHNGHRRLARAVQERLTTYIGQGRTQEEHQRGRAIAAQLKIARNVRDMVQAQPEAAGIGSGVAVGMSVAAQVVGPELALARLAGTVRWLGGARMLTAIERYSTGLTYKAGRMTWANAQGAGKVFLGRAATDGILQYGGAVIVNANKQFSESGTIDGKRLLLESTGGINTTSLFMAGLPGDEFVHSLRNAVVANAFEINRDYEKGWGHKYVNLSWESGLNYAQKVGFSVGADVLSGRYGGWLQKARLRDSYHGNGLPGSQHAYDLWRQRLWLINQASFIGVYGTKIIGGVAGSTAESYILPPANEQTAK